jgi:ABC-type transport system substrate-binding protein
MVMKPVESTGKYRAAPGAAASSARPTARTATASSASDKLLFWDHAGSKIVPCVAKGYDLSADGKTATLLPPQGPELVRRPSLHRR